MRLLVTGATGFIGRALLDEASTEYEVVAVARDPPAGADRVNPVWVRADLTSPGFARALPGEVEVVVHLAQSRQGRDFPDRAIDIADVNVSATVRLLDYAVRRGARRFVFTSTATLYRRSQHPLAEDAPLDCSDGYPATKRAAEIMIGAYGRLLSCSVLRLFTPYGPGQHDDRLIANLVHRVRAAEPISVDGRRGLLLSPIHVSDVVTAVMAAASSDTDGISTLNVGGPEALGIAEIATIIGELLQRPPTTVRRNRSEPGGYVADRRAFSNRYPLLPEPRPFREGLASVLAATTPA